MRAPLSWLREFADIPAAISPNEIAGAFVRVGFEVEDVIYQGVDLQGPLLVGKVTSIEEISGQKKPIRYVGLDCGEGQARFVICGAVNFEVNDLVVVALPGAVLHGNFAISARETYGKTSNGMICSTKELGIGDDHAGIMVITHSQLPVGSDALGALEISDVIFDLAVNPDRGYALSIRGLAREIAGALNLTYRDPVDALRNLEFKDCGVGASATIADPTGASVFYLRTLSNFDPAAQTPLWMRRRIEKMGMRAISLAVDVTNYVMLELGQPLHAFDRATLQGGLTVARAGKAQKFITLDGQERTLHPADLMICDESHPLALAGTMGGLTSEITESTTEICIEAVCFDPISIAKNSRRHKISSEASRRFERGVDPSLAQLASARAAQLLIEYGGAAHLATVSVGEPNYPARIMLEPSYIPTRLGLEISPSKIAALLRVIGADVNEGTFVVTPPPWRSDLQTPADLSEEVARTVGYDAIPSILPPRLLTATLTKKQKRVRAIASSLAAQGLTEVLNFPFTSGEIIAAMGYTGARAATYRLANPMSEDFPVLRTHLLPGLAQTAQRNIARGAKDFALFEIGSIFRNSQKLAPAISPELGKKPDAKTIAAIFASVPPQPVHCAGLLVGRIGTDSWQGNVRSYQWSDALAFVESILRISNLTWEIKRSDFAPWHPGRCAEFIVNGVPVAHAGELHPRVVAQFSLSPRSCAFVVNLDALPESEIVRAQNIGVMPVAVQDVALIIDANISAKSVELALREGAGELLESITLFDRYDKIGEGKISLAFTLTFRAPDRTLTGAEVAQAREAAISNAAVKCGAVARTA